MAVYVDGITEYPLEAIAPPARRHGRLWSHLVADSLEELEAFARRLGLKPAWLHRGDHYDLIPRVRAKSLALGAREDREGFRAAIINNRRRKNGVPEWLTPDGRLELNRRLGNTVSCAARPRQGVLGFSGEA